MSVIKIFEGENNAFILPHFIESNTLRDLRTQLTQDGFVPPNNYQFIFGDVLVFTAQEDILSVKAVATQESTTSDGRNILRVQTSYIPTNKPNEQIAVGSMKGELGQPKSEPFKAAQSEGHLSGLACIGECESREEASNEVDIKLGKFECDSYKREYDQLERLQETSEHSLTPKQWKRSYPILRSPKPWEVRGIKIYSLSEVESATGYEKTRREHWNKEAKSLCCSTSLSRSEVAQKINESWRKEKRRILEDKLESIRCGKEAGPSKSLKKSTLENNMERIRHIESELSAIEEEISKSKNKIESPTNQSTIRRLQSRKSYLCSQMKKAEDSMRKNLRK